MIGRHRRKETDAMADALRMALSGLLVKAAAAGTRLVGALLQEQHDERQVGRP
jgi:hypothetical protein